MSTNVVDSLYRDNKELLDFLQRSGEVSFQIEVDGNFRKILLLSAASYFESVIRDTLIEFFREKTNQSDLVVSFLEKKAIERQYHTLFNWPGNNANSFFSLFGEGFKEFMKDEVKNNKKLDDSIKAFLKIGDSRNQLVHQNFANFVLESTAEDIYQLYLLAIFFIEELPKKLREYKAKT